MFVVKGNSLLIYAENNLSAFHTSVASPPQNHLLNIYLLFVKRNHMDQVNKQHGDVNHPFKWNVQQAGGAFKFIGSLCKHISVNSIMREYN